MTVPVPFIGSIVFDTSPYSASASPTRGGGGGTVGGVPQGHLSYAVCCTTSSMRTTHSNDGNVGSANNKAPCNNVGAASVATTGSSFTKAGMPLATASTTTTTTTTSTIEDAEDEPSMLDGKKRKAELKRECIGYGCTAIVISRKLCSSCQRRKKFVIFISIVTSSSCFLRFFAFVSIVFIFIAVLQD
eukprot:TRINITY_DN2135_c0_g1_i3.p1 TRINITY_DN2135_c0_g1~~TRINITY_DN2135_c0_g1_i3.p1  ORF type:complete len:188 (+),score=27.50 TRINITY_DN2135_c0_g1_i3:58-621(+)